LPQPHTEASGSILTQFQIEQSDRRWLIRTLGHPDRSLLNRELSQQGLPLLIRTMGHRDRSLLNSKLSNRIEDGSSTHWVIRTDLYPSAE
jgi:hypothetical protein